METETLENLEELEDEQTETEVKAEEVPAKDEDTLGESGLAALRAERERRKELEKEIKALKRQNESETERAIREASEKAAEEASEVWKSKYVTAEIRTALTDAGVTKASDRLLNLIDLESVSIDEDGTVSGIDEQIEDLKKEFPELFNLKKRVGKGDTATKTESSAPLTIGEQLERKMRNK